MCQKESESEHPFDALSGSFLLDFSPIDLLFRNAKEFCNVADPFQPFPAVFGSVHAKDQEHILRRESEHRLAGKGNRNQTLPQALPVERESKITFRDSPLKIHSDLTFRFDKHVELRPQKRYFLMITIVLQLIALFGA